MEKRYTFIAVLLLGVIGLAGCGGEGRKKAPAQIKLARPAEPSASDCGKGLSNTSERPERPATPGTYSYSTEGEKALIGAKRHVSKLPAQTEVIVTPARKLGNILCYVTQRRYGPSLGDTATLLVRGKDVYLRGMRFQSGGYIKTLAPRQPLLSLSGSELDWSGSFNGPTSGRYAAEVIGRKQIKVGPKPVRAVGIKARISYAGEIEGWERSTSWVAIDHNLMVAESVEKERKFGLDKLRLEYESKLQSLGPK